MQCSFEVYMKVNYSVTPHPVLGLIYDECYGRKANIFVSNFWKSQFADLVTGIELFAETHDGEECLYWIDVLLNDQWNATDLSFDWWTNTFASAVGEIGHTLVVLSSWDATNHWDRAWCVFEIFCTITKKSKLTVQFSSTQQIAFVETLRNDYDRIMHVLCNIDLRQSETWNPKDREMIFAAIEQEEGGFDGLNDIVCAEMRESFARNGRSLALEVAAGTGGSGNEMLSEAQLSDLNHVARLLKDLGKYNEAELMFERALRSQEKALGSEHPITLGTLNNLGSLRSDQGRFDEAKAMFERALRGFEKHFGRDHLTTLDAVNNLGALLSDQGKYDEAKPMFERALQGQELALGPDSPSPLQTVINLGALLKNQGKLDEAQAMLDRALRGFERTPDHSTTGLGPNQIGTLNALKNLGSLLRDQGKYDEAKPMLERALRGFEKSFGPNHPNTLDTVNCLANLFKVQGKLDEAKAMYERAKNGFEKTLGPKHKTVIEIVNNLAAVLVQMALKKGEKPWGRSTVMFVGAGRAGKTGTERSMLGYAFAHTESTIGINNEHMFEVTSELANVDGDANFAGGSRWLLAEKAEKEYESALAKLASAIQQGKVDKDNLLLEKQKVVEQKAKLDAMKKDMVKANATSAAASVPLSSVPSSSSSSSATAQPVVPSSVALTPTTTTATTAGGSSYDSLINEDPLSATVPQEVDLEYALRMLAKDLQMNSKLLLTFLDFGGQKAFESINQFFMVEQAVYVVVFNMECFLTQDRISVDPKKGITTWSECLKVALHWLNTVVVHTMKPGSTKPAPIFIVGTHKDTVPLPADHQAISKAFSAALGGNNPALNSLQRNDTESLCFFPIDNTLGRSDPTMITLTKRIEAVIETQAYVQKLLPLLWFRVLDWMNGQSRFYLMYDEVAKFAKDNGFDMSTTQAVDDMLSMFHECSVLMWHNVDGLRHIVILSPIQFFVSHTTNLLRQHTGTATDATQHKLPKSIEDKIQSDTLLRSDFAQMVSRGILTGRLLDVLLSEAEESRVVVQLLVTYALLVPLRREEAEVVSGGGGGGDDTTLLRYLVPALLPEGTNDLATAAAGSADGHRFFVFFAVTGMISDDCLRHGDMRDKGFLPGGLFVRLVARLLVWSQDTTTACSWRCDQDSITLFFGAQQFHVTHRPDINAIQVRMFDRHTPLAIHARLKNILELLIAECFSCLSMSTLVEYSGDAPMQGAVRPSSSIRWLVPLSAIRNRVVFLIGGSQGVRRLTATEVETGFAAWLVRTGASDVELYDLFFSHCWDWNDKSFVRKLVDLLAQYTTGDNPPRAIVSFLDVDSLEDGLNLQEAFVCCLVRSRVMVVVVSWAAIARMMTHDSNGKKTTIFTIEDNVLIEWLCSLRLWHLKRIHVMPVFFGKRTDANSVGGSFFEVDAATGTSMLERLADVEAKPSLAKAVQLMTKAGVWTSGSPVEPSAFGLTSLSVRAIVTAMTGQLGIPACDSKNPAELLRSCASKITGILAKSGSGGEPTVVVPVVVAVDYTKAWSIITDPRRAVSNKFDELTAYFQEQGIVEVGDLEVQDEDVIAMILGYLNPTGQKLFAKAMGLQIS